MISEFNQHQQDARGRLDTLAKSIFLLGGGTLTLSINAFTGNSYIQIPYDMIGILQLSWLFLFSSIVMFFLLVGIVLYDSFILGEKWRKYIENREEIINHESYVKSYFVLGFLGGMCFIVGFALMAFVAISTLEFQYQ